VITALARVVDEEAELVAEHARARRILDVEVRRGAADEHDVALELAVRDERDEEARHVAIAHEAAHHARDGDAVVAAVRRPAGVAAGLGDDLALARDVVEVERAGGGVVLRDEDGVRGEGVGGELLHRGPQRGALRRPATRRRGGAGGARGLEDVAGAERDGAPVVERREEDARERERYRGEDARERGEAGARAREDEVHPDRDENGARRHERGDAAAVAVPHEEGAERREDGEERAEPARGLAAHAAVERAGDDVGDAALEGDARAGDRERRDDDAAREDGGGDAAARDRGELDDGDAPRGAPPRSTAPSGGRARARRRSRGRSRRSRRPGPRARRGASSRAAGRGRSPLARRRACRARGAAARRERRTSG
jgi:hypothetical protein